VYKQQQQQASREELLNCGECDAKRVMTLALPFFHPFSLSTLFCLSDDRPSESKTTEKQKIKVTSREGRKSKVTVMFQNDKTAIYEFIFIDHIVFIFTAFVEEFERVNAWRQMWRIIRIGMG
jgi:hypothetical protein